MPELPRHPDEGARTGGEPDRRQARPSRRALFGWMAGIVLLAIVVLLHLTGVLGPGTH